MSELDVAVGVRVPRLNLTVDASLASALRHDRERIAAKNNGTPASGGTAQ